MHTNSVKDQVLESLEQSMDSVTLDDKKITYTKCFSVGPMEGNTTDGTQMESYRIHIKMLEWGGGK